MGIFPLITALYNLLYEGHVVLYCITFDSWKLSLLCNSFLEDHIVLY